jgi:hypothetical protein
MEIFSVEEEVELEEAHFSSGGNSTARGSMGMISVLRARIS